MQPLSCACTKSLLFCFVCRPKHRLSMSAKPIAQRGRPFNQELATFLHVSFLQRLLITWVAPSTSVAPVTTPDTDYSLNALVKSFTEKASCSDFETTKPLVWVPPKTIGFSVAFQRAFQPSSFAGAWANSSVLWMVMTGKTGSFQKTYGRIFTKYASILVAYNPTAPTRSVSTLLRLLLANLTVNYIATCWTSRVTSVIMIKRNVPLSHSRKNNFTVGHHHKSHFRFRRKAISDWQTKDIEPTPAAKQSQILPKSSFNFEGFQSSVPYVGLDGFRPFYSSFVNSCEVLFRPKKGKKWFFLDAPRNFAPALIARIISTVTVSPHPYARSTKTTLKFF